MAAPEPRKLSISKELKPLAEQVRVMLVTSPTLCAKDIELRLNSSGFPVSFAGCRSVLQYLCTCGIAVTSMQGNTVHYKLSPKPVEEEIPRQDFPPQCREPVAEARWVIQGTLTRLRVQGKRGVVCWIALPPGKMRTEEVQRQLLVRGATILAEARNYTIQPQEESRPKRRRRKKHDI